MPGGEERLQGCKIVPFSCCCCRWSPHCSQPSRTPLWPQLVEAPQSHHSQTTMRDGRKKRKQKPSWVPNTVNHANMSGIKSLCEGRGL